MLAQKWMKMMKIDISPARQHDDDDIRLNEAPTNDMHFVQCACLAKKMEWKLPEKVKFK